MRKVRTTTILGAGFILFAPAVLPAVGMGTLPSLTIPAAFAQEHQGGGQSGGRGGSSSRGGRDDEHEKDSGSHSGGSSGSSGGHSGGSGVEGRVFRGGKEGARGGEGGGDRGIEDRVFRGGQGGTGGAGGSRPVWAGGAVPETVELGRLNMARSPDQVLARALNEAYTTNLDKDGNGVIDPDAAIDAIESPMANLALYAEALSGTRKVAGNWTFDQAASFLGKAADKTIPISVDTVRAMGIILELPESDFSTYEYDRSAAHPTAVDRVFGGATYVGTGFEAFAQAADDERAIVSFEHDEVH